MTTSSSDSLHAKDGQPVVTVTIPILNAERFLAEAIESVIAQTYPSWELLLVEDGSTDGSPEIAKRYTREWPDKIRYLEQSPLPRGIKTKVSPPQTP